MYSTAQLGPRNNEANNKNFTRFVFCNTSIKLVRLGNFVTFPAVYAGTAAASLSVGGDVRVVPSLSVGCDVRGPMSTLEIRRLR